MDSNRTYIALALIFVVIALTLLRSSNVGLVDYYDDGTHTAQRSGLNIISGDGIDISSVNDAANSRVNLTVKTTAATGTATLVAGQTFVMVTHGLGFAPDRVLVTPTNDWAGATWYVSSKNSTQFAITLAAVHGTNITFDWRASKDE